MQGEEQYPKREMKKDSYPILERAEFERAWPVLTRSATARPLEAAKCAFEIVTGAAIMAF